MIEIEGLTRRFGDYDAVRDLTLTIEPGEWFLLAGPNGAGKTTTMRLLMGILQPDRGSTRVCGCDPVTQPMEVRRLIGYLPERFFPYEHLTGREYLQFVARAHGLRGQVAENQVQEVLELVDLSDDQAEQLVKGYSFGMVKKVAFGAAILQKPKVLLLDEPTAGLDPKGARRIYDVIAEFVRRGTTCLMSSHLLLEVQDICNRVGFINAGQLIEVLTLAELRQADPPRTLPEHFLDLVGRPERPDVARFFGETGAPPADAAPPSAP